MISDRLWRTRYSADPSIIGRPLSLNDTPYIVVGVMPAKFHYPRRRRRLAAAAVGSHSAQPRRALHGSGRAADGRDDVRAGAERRRRARPRGCRTSSRRPTRAGASRLVPLLDEQLGYYRPALMVLFGAVGLLLVIGCLNVASLLLTRALSREREIAVRVAMGAAPRQLVTQLLAESCVLSVAGAVVGIVAAAAARCRSS